MPAEFSGAVYEHPLVIEPWQQVQGFGHRPENDEVAFVGSSFDQPRGPLLGKVQIHQHLSAQRQRPLIRGHHVDTRPAKPPQRRPQVAGRPLLITGRPEGPRRQAALNPSPVQCYECQQLLAPFRDLTALSAHRHVGTAEQVHDRSICVLEAAITEAFVRRADTPSTGSITQGIRIAIA